MYTLLKAISALIVLVTVVSCKDLPEQTVQSKMEQPDVSNSNSLNCSGETEPAFSGKYWDHNEDGNYYCSNCKILLFNSEAKFESGTGWPSFDEPAIRNAIAQRPDTSLGMKRTEVICSNCEAHLGHLFEDGPTSTGMRYCVNSYALQFSTNNKTQ